MGCCNLCSVGGSALIKQHLPVPMLAKKARTVTMNDFRVEKQLGKGSFGKVLLVTKTDSQVKYALKAINKSSLKDVKKKLHALSERCILEEVTSEFVVKLHFAFQSPTKLFMVLDFMQGGDLYFRLRKLGRFSLHIARFYAAEVLLALEDLHRHNIIYRDLKPENVLLDYQGHIKLADFNLAKLIGPNERLPRTMCGTPEYVAPEALLAQHQTRPMDFWSFGVLLYEMLLGVSPFVSQSLSEMFGKILAAEYSLHPSINRDAAALIRELLKTSPADRPQSVEDIKTHAFFDTVNWQSLRKKEVTPPLKPRLSGSEDISAFPACAFEESPLLKSEENSPFRGFTYIADTEYI